MSDETNATPVVQTPVVQTPEVQTPETVPPVQNEQDPQVKAVLYEVERAKAVAKDTGSQPRSKPRLFVKGNDAVNIDVDVLYRYDNGEVLSVFTAGVPVDLEKITQYLGHERLSFEFSRPQYNQVSRYKTRSTVVTDGVNTVDMLKVRDFLIVYHLKKWNIADDEGKTVEMKFDPNGAMSDETMEIFYALTPSIIDVVMQAFERRILMT